MMCHWILLNLTLLLKVNGQENENGATGTSQQPVTAPAATTQQQMSIPPGAYYALVFANLATPAICPGTENSGKR